MIVNIRGWHIVRSGDNREMEDSAETPNGAERSLRHF